MPSPVFLWERAYGGAHRSLPYAPMMDFRRADRVVRPYGWIWRRCSRADVGSELSAASGG